MVDATHHYRISELSAQDRALLRRALKSRGWRVSTFADRIGISKRSIFRVLSGEARPGPDMLQRICQGLDLEVVPARLVKRRRGKRGGVRKKPR
jgi:transcriptional regulator with XRE-family HTH domain